MQHFYSEVNEIACIQHFYSLFGPDFIRWQRNGTTRRPFAAIAAGADPCWQNDGERTRSKTETRHGAR